MGPPGQPLHLSYLRFYFFSKKYIYTYEYIPNSVSHINRNKSVLLSLIIVYYFLSSLRFPKGFNNMQKVFNNRQLCAVFHIMTRLINISCRDIKVLKQI